MNKVKKSVLICLVVALVLVPSLMLLAACPPHPDPYEEIDGIMYILDEESAHVVCFYPEGAEEGDVVDCVIPATVTYEDSVYTVVDFAEESMFTYDCYVGKLTLPATFERFNIDHYDPECFSRLHTIEVDDANEYMCSVDGVLFSEDKTEMLYFPIARRQSEFVLPQETTSALHEGIARCVGLESIAVEEGNTLYSAHDGVLYSDNGSRLAFYPLGKRDSTLYIDSAVASVAVESNLRRNAYITRVQVDESNPYLKAEQNVLLSRDGSVMFYCPELEGGCFAIPDGVSVVGPYSLPNVFFLYVPDSVTVLLDGVTGTLPENLRAIYFEGDIPLHCDLSENIERYTGCTREQFEQLIGVN